MWKQAVINYLQVQKRLACPLANQTPKWHSLSYCVLFRKGNFRMFLLKIEKAEVTQNVLLGPRWTHPICMYSVIHEPFSQTRSSQCNKNPSHHLEVSWRSDASNRKSICPKCLGGILYSICLVCLSTNIWGFYKCYWLNPRATGKQYNLIHVRKQQQQSWQWKPAAKATSCRITDASGWRSHFSFKVHYVSFPYSQKSELRVLSNSEEGKNKKAFTSHLSAECYCHGNVLCTLPASSQIISYFSAKPLAHTWLRFSTSVR